MEKIPEIIKKIRNPVAFATRESYRHLIVVKDLGATLTGYLQELERALEEGADRGGLTPEALRNFISAMKINLSGFDNLEPAQKKAAIEACRQLLDKFSPPSSDQQPGGSEDEVSVSISAIQLAREKLSVPIESLPGVGPKTAALLKRKGINSIDDLLLYLPRAYEDRRFIQKIANLSNGVRATIVGKVTSSGRKFYGRRPVYEVEVADGTGQLTAKWFRGNNNYLQNIFRQGAGVIMSGAVSGFLTSKEMIHPDHEFIGDDADSLIHFKRIVPIYSETEGLHQKTIRRIMYRLVEQKAQYFLSPIPAAIVQKRNLPAIGQAIRFVHFPPDHYNPELCNQALSDSHRRLIYDEFFFFQLGMALKKAGHHIEAGPSFKINGAILSSFYRSLPFALTEAQKRVISEIERDLSGGGSMHRLLQGDVGSGKTVVAAAAIITACDNGYQAVLMAPTEILAEQHYHNVKGWCEPLGLKTLLLTGRIKNKVRVELLETIAGGEANIIVGTHAILEEDVIFANLGLIVIDEQHRFGVSQRITLRKKGRNPHVMVMTATPIPRTLAMTVYGDLDVSVIDELPPGKKVIRTRLFTEEKRQLVYQIVQREITKGNQAFIVYPLVEESESLDLKDATNMALHLQRDIFPELKVGLIHGRMKSQEKEEVMRLFKDGKTDILVSTTVVEVGIDIPEASVMVIEHAERFGLSQLHQLRGRVGRKDKPAFCLLLTQGGQSADAHKRLRIMEKTNDGFAIAEEDLAIRGPGEFMGTRQSGLPDFRIGNIIRDARLLAEAKADATELIKSDPRLELRQHQAMKVMMIIKWKGKLDLLKTG